MLLLVKNGTLQTTGSFTTVSSTTALRTMLQIKPTIPCKVVEWGFSTDGISVATPIQWELIETGTVGASVTTLTAADVTQTDGADGVTSSLLTFGANATGFTATAEGTITSTRLFWQKQLQPNTPYEKQFPLGREPYVIAGNVLRLRCICPTPAVNVEAWVLLSFGG